MAEGYDQKSVFVGRMTGEIQLAKLSELFKNVWNNIYTLIDDFRNLTSARYSEFRVDPYRTAKFVAIQENRSFNYLTEVLLIIFLLRDELERLVGDSKEQGERVKHFVGHLIEANDILSGKAWQGIRADEIDVDDARSQETMQMIRGKLDQLKQRLMPNIESCRKHVGFSRALGFMEVWIRNCVKPKNLWDSKTLPEMLRSYNI